MYQNSKRRREIRALVCENWEKNGEGYSREHKSEKKWRRRNGGFEW